MKTPVEIKKGLAEAIEEVSWAVEGGDAHDLRDACDMAHASMADALAYIQQLDAQVPRWISVEEMLPEPGDDVAVLIDIGGNRWMHRAAWVLDDGELCVLGCVKADHQEIRYWMLLPEIPKEEEDREK